MNTVSVVFSEEQIQKRVREIALEVSRDCGEGVLQVVGILESGFVFMADLVRKLTCPVICHFVRMKLRDSGADVQPVRIIEYSSIRGVESTNLLLVDAVVGSGITHDYLAQQLLLKKPKSLRTAALVDRSESRRVAFRLDYAGFPWDGGYLVGYGLASDGLYRNISYLGTVSTAAKAA